MFFLRKVVNDKKDQYKIELINGIKEALVISKTNIFKNLDYKTYLYVDVGGGSTELSIINNSKINLEGINNIDEIDINNAEILGYKIKHLGLSEIENGKLIQRVHPCLIKKESRISNVNGVLNAVIIEGKPIGKSVLQGEGAGPGPTTSALVSDICSVLRGNIKFPFSVSHSNRKKIMPTDLSEKIFSSYIRLDVIDKKGVLSSITKTMSKNKISVKRLIQNPFKGKKFASIVIISHKAKNKNLVKCIKQLKKNNFILKNPKFIRIEEI